MFNAFAFARLWLEQNAGPWAPWAVLTGAIWLNVYFVRRFLPTVWLRFEGFGPAGGSAAAVFQSLPSVLVGALVGVMASGGTFDEAWKGALAGSLAPLWHHFLKNYSGAVGGAAVLVPKPPKLPLLLLVVCLPGCAAFQSAKPYIKTVRDVARAECAAHYSATQGVSLEDAFETYCATEKAIGPFLDILLAKQKAAKAGASPGEACAKAE